MRFLDKDGKEVVTYNPFNEVDEIDECREIKLAENEELIGVYGTYDKLDQPPNISTLGFVVKVLLQTEASAHMRWSKVLKNPAA